MKLVLALALSASTAAAQSFDVASVKPSPPLTGDLYRANLGRALNGEVTLSNATLTDCLKFAFGFTTDEQIWGPDWIKSKEVRFDIIAKAAPQTPPDQLKAMLQTLLTERFQLAYHREQKAIAHLVLGPGRKAPKLQEAKEGSDASANNNNFGHIVSNRMTMQVLTLLLSRFLRQPVVDRTGLKGAYEVNLEWTPDRPKAAEATDDPPAGPSIFAAVQEQLGLKLEASKSPLDVIVVDRVEKTPIAN